MQKSWFAVGQLQRVSKYVAQFVFEVTRLGAERIRHTTRSPVFTVLGAIAITRELRGVQNGEESRKADWKVVAIVRRAVMGHVNSSCARDGGLREAAVQ